MGLREQAYKLVAMASDIIDRKGETLAVSDLHLQEAALALETGDRMGAEVRLQEAMAIAREQSAKIWELRAAIDLARLWLSSDRTDEARALLQQIYDGIDDGDCVEGCATAHSILAGIIR